MAIAQELWKFAKPIPHTHRSTGADRGSRIGALGEATSSQNLVMTYPCYVRIAKPSPLTIYYAYGLAWGSHTGPQ